MRSKRSFFALCLALGTSSVVALAASCGGNGSTASTTSGTTTGTVASLVGARSGAASSRSPTGA